VLKLSVVSKHACFESRTPLVNGCVSDAVLHVAVQNIHQVVTVLQ